MTKQVFGFTLVFLSLWAGCAGAASELPPTLAATGLDSDPAALTPAEGVMEFQPQYPLYTDHAEKKRWIQLPPGSRIDSSDVDHWVFPAGTKLWKEFAWDGVRVETRYMLKGEDGTWRYATYLWNASQTEATLAPEKGIQSYRAIPHSESSHDIPGVRDCKKCHEQEKGDSVLGFSALQLSDDWDEHFVPKPRESIMTRLSLSRQLSHVPANQRIASHTPTGRAAMGYLHGNCGHCHNPNGNAAYTGLFLRHEGAPQTEEREPVFETGVGKLSSFSLPNLTESKQIEPGSPSRSVVFRRMQRRPGDGRMPPLGTKVVDCQGISVVGAWIREMTGH